MGGPAWCKLQGSHHTATATRIPTQVATAQRLESDLRLQQAKHEAALAELKLKHDTVSICCDQATLGCCTVVRGSPLFW